MWDEDEKISPLSPRGKQYKDKLLEKLSDNQRLQGCRRLAGALLEYLGIIPSLPWQASDDNLRDATRFCVLGFEVCV